MTGESMQRLTAQELDEVYTKLCYGLTECGIERTPGVLARLSLLLMRAVDDAAVIEHAVDEALRLPTAST